MKIARELEFQLSEGLVNFRTHFHHMHKNSAVLRTSELVAELNEKLERPRLDYLVKELDDTLLLTSLATRHRCVCRGWSFWTANSETVLSQPTRCSKAERDKVSGNVDR